jgi:hypothetical protein
MIFNNPQYKPWSRHPVGEVTFPRFTKVTTVEPTAHESGRLSSLSRESGQRTFVIQLEGRRVFVTKDALLTRDEFIIVKQRESES